MAAVGITVGVNGVAGAAVKSAQALCDIVDTVRRAPKEFTAKSKDPHAFQEVVSSVQIALRDSSVENVILGDRRLTSLVQNLEHPLKNCLMALGQLKPRIQPYLKATKDGGTKISSVDVSWYLNRRDIAECRSRLEATNLRWIQPLRPLSCKSRLANSPRLGC